MLNILFSSFNVEPQSIKIFADNWLQGISVSEADLTSTFDKKDHSTINLLIGKFDSLHIDNETGMSIEGYE